jgi:hypothetical protein
LHYAKCARSVPQVKDILLRGRSLLDRTGVAMKPVGV